MGGRLPFLNRSESGVNKIRQDHPFPNFDPKNIRGHSDWIENRTTGKLVLACLCVITVAVASGIYYQTLKVGFLLDDYYHLDYLIKASNGDSAELLRVLIGSWSGPTGLNSFRPLASIGLLLDFISWKTNASGYHLTNLVLFAGCCISLLVLVSQLLAGAGKIRYPCALAASVLFAVYPLHPESVAWVVGRVDVQCTLFFLLSLICYFKFRTAGRGLMLALSLAFFTASLASKEMAVVLPVVVLAAEYLLARDLRWTKVRRRFLLSAAYFALLGLFAAVRAVAIGELVGGYGATNISSLSAGLGHFFDLASAKKIVFGVNEERPLGFELFPYAAGAFVVCLLPCFIASVSTRFLRTAIFLLLWTAVSILPAYQIWHVYPNLVGSRLFFLGSAPMCALLSLGALIPFSATTSTSTTLTRGLRFLAASGLLSLMAFWSLAVHNNIQVWREAGEAMRGIKAQLGALYQSIDDGRYVHLVDLPQDHSGAGLIGRPAYLRTMISPPLADRDYTFRVVTTELELSRARDFILPSLVRQVALDDTTAVSLRWSAADRKYERWSVPDSDARPSHTLLAKKLEKATFSRQGDVLWFKTEELSPFTIGWVKLGLVLATGGDAGADKPARVRMLFRSADQPPSWIDYSLGPGPVSFPIVPEPGDEHDGSSDAAATVEYFFIPYRYRSWALNGPVQELGFELGTTDIERIERAYLEAGSPDRIFPRVDLTETARRATVDHGVLLPCDSSSSVSVKFDASSIIGARGVDLFVGTSGTSIALSATRMAPADSAILFRRFIMQTEGIAVLPDAVTRHSPGAHEVAVLAVDDQEKPVGFLSEPRYFKGCP